MKKIKGEPIIVLGVSLLALTVGGVVGVGSAANSIEVKSNIEKNLDAEIAKMQEKYIGDAYKNVEDNNSQIKNELPNKSESVEIKEEKVESFAYPCDKSKMKIVDYFNKKYLGVDKTYLEAEMLTPAFNKGCAGMVYRLPENSVAYSIADGVVVDIQNNTSKNFGYSIEIENEKGFKTIYSGLSNVLVQKNQKVSKEQKIGSIGNINNVLLNNELKFYILEGNVIVDPAKYIGK